MVYYCVTHIITYLSVPSLDIIPKGEKNTPLPGAHFNSLPREHPTAATSTSVKISELGFFSQRWLDFMGFPSLKNVDDTRLGFSSQLVVVKLTIHHINHSS